MNHLLARIRSLASPWLLLITANSSVIVGSLYWGRVVVVVLITSLRIHCIAKSRALLNAYIVCATSPSTWYIALPCTYVLAASQISELPSTSNWYATIFKISTISSSQSLSPPNDGTTNDGKNAFINPTASSAMNLAFFLINTAASNERWSSTPTNEALS